MPSEHSKDLMLSAALVDDMAKRTGTDLEEAVLDGRISMDDLAEMVLRCARCACPEDCAMRLMDRTGGASMPPEYCRNRDLLVRLAKTGERQSEAAW